MSRKRTGRHRPTRRSALQRFWPPAALILAGSALIGSALTPAQQSAPHWANNTGPSATATETPAVAGTADASKPETGPPQSIRIPRIGVESSLVALGLQPDGSMQTPQEYAQAGWFEGGPSPGDIGPAVIAGHVDSVNGPAIFFRLGELRSGDLIEVQRGTAWVRFRVVETGRYPKTDFPTARVYDPTPGPELRLITCGGAFDRDRRSYMDNFVVYAVAA
jgi:sortase (surface protein transpeptidase)